jgi:transmembrane sensor
VPQPAAGRLLSDTLARAESRTRKRRQVLRGALGLGGVAVGATWLADRHQPVAQWSADLRTGTGERREFLLPDGSRLTLDARSAVDLDFRPGHRRVRLRQGALLAEATPQADLGPAFTVHTVHGQVQALGTRFTVRLQDSSSLVGMLEHSVEITTASGQQRQLHEGHSACFNATDIEDADTLSPEGTAAWRHGMLQVHDQPLADVVQALRAYRPGVLRIARVRRPCRSMAPMRWTTPTAPSPRWPRPCPSPCTVRWAAGW